MRYLESRAQISNDGQYRYWLARRISLGQRSILFVGLNPSTADADHDDPTIRRCVGFARKWGFDWMLMGNLYAYRSTNPKNLRQVDDPIGAGNRAALEWLMLGAEIIVASWGRHKLTKEAQVLADLILSVPNVRCLGEWPRHPLYLPAGTKLQTVGRAG